MLDTAALISWPISELYGGLIVSHQEDELLRISPDRAAILDSMGLVFCQPNQDSIDLTLDAAKRSGDISGISETDLALVSLALERSAQLITDDYRMQNIATVLGIEWQGVSQVGISEVWSWILICSGCRSEYEAPNQRMKNRKIRLLSRLWIGAEIEEKEMTEKSLILVSNLVSDTASIHV